jgi:hypothetical protein
MRHTLEQRAGPGAVRANFPRNVQKFVLPTGLQIAAVSYFLLLLQDNAAGLLLSRGHVMFCRSILGVPGRSDTTIRCFSLALLSTLTLPKNPLPQAS